MWALSSLRISHTLWLLEWQSMDIIWTNLFDCKAKKKYTTLADLGEKKIHHSMQTSAPVLFLRFIREKNREVTIRQVDHLTGIKS